MSIKANNKEIIEEDEIYTVYIHIVSKKISKYNYDKYYVGITNQPINKRWANGYGYKGQPFYKAINKYGWNNIKHLIIATNLLEDEAKEFEKVLISKLKCNARKYKYGYNVTDGGDGVTGCIASKETKKKLSESHLGIKNPFYNKKHSTESRLKMSKSRKGIFKDGKKVYQFDLNGNYVNTYNSARDAIRSLSKLLHRSNICSSNIGKHIKSQTPYCNFLWGFESNIIIIDDVLYLNYKYNKRIYSYAKNVYQFNMNGDYIRKYSSIREAEIKLGVKGTLGRNVESHKEFLGYLWGFDKDIFIVNNIPKLNYTYKKPLHKNYKTIYMFDSSGIFIKKYNCAIEASNDTNINNNYITRAATKRNKSGGYYWRYENGIDFDKNNTPVLKRG